MNGATSEGVYFLGNDRIYDWALAFLESLRTYNPDLALRLIPFDQKCERLKALAQRYRFDIHDDPEAFERLERIGRLVGRGIVEYGHHWFRRFAAFAGPLDNFLYLDARVVVLSDLREMLAARREIGVDLLHYDQALDQAYLPGKWRDELVARRRPAGFLSGIWGSRRGLFTLEELERFGAEADRVGDALNRHNSDQCFLNFCCDTKPVSYAGYFDVMPDLVRSAWARQPGIYRWRRDYFLWDHGGLDHNKRLALMHWAGTRRGPLMPYAGIFLRYALKGRPWRRMFTRLGWALRYPPLKAIDMLHRARWINMSYHILRHRLLGKPMPDRIRIATDRVGGGKGAVQ